MDFSILTESRLTILAEGALGIETSKTAASMIRFASGRIQSVIDSRLAGQTVQEALGFGGEIPIVDSLESALSVEPSPEALLVGVAPQGGRLPPRWKDALLKGLDEGLHLIAGLHTHLRDDEDLRRQADSRDRTLIDLRASPPNLPVGTGRAMETSALRILTVGMDCNSGKMTTSLELQAALETAGIRTNVGATGQTGILLVGRGIAVDAVVSDFISGAAEQIVLEAADGADVVLIEGQGSLMHPGYSGVTLGLIHGTLPQAMIFTWVPARPHIYGGNHDWVAFPDLSEAVRRYEDALAWACPSVPGKVIGLSVATYRLSESDARAAVEHARRVTGLPATDPIRFGPAPLVDAIRGQLEQ